MVDRSRTFAQGYSRLGLAEFRRGNFPEALKVYNAGLAKEAGNAALKEGVAEVKAAQRAQVRTATHTASSACSFHQNSPEHRARTPSVLCTSRLDQFQGKHGRPTIYNKRRNKFNARES